MDERVARTIRHIGTFEELAQFEANARKRQALTDDMERAIRERSAQLGRGLIAARTGFDLTDLSPAEEKIVQAASEYVGVKKREGSNAGRTLDQLRRRGLRGAAEASVAKARPTQGFRTLANADLEHLSYEQIVLDHPDEFSSRALWYSRRTLGLPNDIEKPPSGEQSPTQLGLAEATTSDVSMNDDAQPVAKRNPTWSRDELVLALDLYLRFRGSPPAKNSVEVAELSAFLGKLGRAIDMTEAQTYRNTNGVYMKMMNFRRLDPDYTAGGRVGLTRGNKEEEVIWNEFVNDPAQLAATVAAIRTLVNKDEEPDRAELTTGRSTLPSAPYWVFVCNPKKWEIDRFLDRGIEHDTWGVRPSDRNRFAPGQLGIIRVGVDQRTAVKRDGKPPLEPGVYALCEVESEAFEGTGANDEFWAPGEARKPGWPTVKLRYLRTYASAPLTIKRLTAERPGTDPLLLNGFQAASFPISADDFRAVLGLLGEDPDDLPSAGLAASVTADQIAAMEQEYLRASPEVRERVSRSVERGPVGALVKRANGFKCQVCESLGVNSLGFLKRNNEPYVEAHHVMPVSKREIGSLAASNIMTLCPNHHRQMHYGGIEVIINAVTFEFVIDGTPIKITRFGVGTNLNANSDLEPADKSTEDRSPAENKS